MAKIGRHFLIDPDLYAAAKDAAAAEGRTITDVITAALRRLVAPARSDTDPGTTPDPT